MYLRKETSLTDKDPENALTSIKRPAPSSLCLQNEGIWLPVKSGSSRRRITKTLFNTLNFSPVSFAHAPQNQYSAAYCTSKVAGMASHVFGALPPAVLIR